jgi:hypothetical protein
MNNIQIFIAAFLSAMGFMVLCFMLRPAPKKTLYKEGKKLLILAFVLCAQSVFGQLFVSNKQIRQDGNDQLIETELRLVLTGDSVIIQRSNERSAYPLRSVRKTRKGIIVRFGQSNNKIILFYCKKKAFTLQLGESHYFCLL